MAWRWVGAAGLTYVTGVGVVYAFARKPAPAAAAGCGGGDGESASGTGAAAAAAGGACARADPAEGYRIFEARAEEYDGAVGATEALWGMGLMRRALLRHARGDVLEVSAGTGRNVGYYRAPAVARVVMADRSPAVLRVAQRKVTGGEGELGIEFSTAVMDVGALDARDGAYDTVVDTFGLCSCADPSRALAEVCVARVGGWVGGWERYRPFASDGASVQTGWINSGECVCPHVCVCCVCVCVCV